MQEGCQTVGEPSAVMTREYRKSVSAFIRMYGFYSFCPSVKAGRGRKFRKLTDGNYRIVRVWNDVNICHSEISHRVDCRYLMWADCWDMKVNRLQSGYVTTTPNATSTPRPSWAGFRKIRHSHLTIRLAVHISPTSLLLSAEHEVRFLWV